MTRFASTRKKTTCYHCGDDCVDEIIVAEQKSFCCHGCKMVYEIINQSGLCDYYDIEKFPGISQKIKVREGKFAILDNPDVISKLIHFSDKQQQHVTFYLPQMHCSSCIWLLEHLPKLSPGVVKSTVNFPKKEVTVIYNSEAISLRKTAELLARIGYEPHISLKDMDSSKLKKYDRSKIYKIGIAGFCFGNIMLLSFPEYFSSGDIAETQLKHIFNFLNLGLSLPVFFYCAAEFFTSAYKGLRHKFLNIDAPIALAILIAFGRSIYEITTFTGAGYLDSMSGIVFFMLLGRFFQDKTYQTLTFDRDYTSYFPIGVTVILKSGADVQIPVSQLKKGERIRIHSQEIIPADCMLFKGKASIDYSFVSGESAASEKSIGEIIYAGGKQLGGAIELEVIKEVSQSYLTQLWNNDIFKKDRPQKKISFVHEVSRYFTYVLFSIAIITAAYWYVNDSSRIWNAVTAILIVACPCALLLSATFTNGNIIARLQRAGLYIKNATVLESISEADTMVFDKTGTITLQGHSQVSFQNGALSAYEQGIVRTIASQSTHPLSKAIVSFLPATADLPVKNYAEKKGHGSSANIDRHFVKLGSAEFVTGEKSTSTPNGSRVFVSINNEVIGDFLISTTYRPGLSEVVNAFKPYYKLAVISGDNNAEEKNLRQVFGKDAELRFEQSPHQKLQYIKDLQEKGHRIIMLGDGLNDAGALQQSDAGIAVTDDVNNFSPACDAIFDGKNFFRLSALINYCKKEKTIIYGSFFISILYNIVGITYAVQGLLSPVIAAILMPASSISIVLYTTILSSFFARKIKN